MGIPASVMEQVVGSLHQTAQASDTITPEMFEAAFRRAETGSASAGPLEAWLTHSVRLPTFSISGLDAEPAPVSPDDLKEVDLVVTGKLGEGGMGVVHEATQNALQRQVAVKALRPAVEEARLVNALLGEALLMGQLEHPNIVPIYSLGQESKRRPLLLMKRISGVTWDELIHDDEHTFWHEQGVEDRLQFHLQVLIQVSNAVDFAHSRDIVHRDIKPENVIVGAYGEVYLIDWGVALRLGERQNKDRLLGTPSYMAPEMAECREEDIDGRTDVYLMGATLHEVLTQKRRHPGDNFARVLTAAVKSEPWAYDTNVPQELAELANRATARQRDERPESAREFRDALRDYLTHRGSLTITEQGQRNLERLEELIASADADDDDDAAEAAEAELQRAFTDSQLRFRLALEEWPENPHAQRGLQRCLESMLRHELQRRNLDAARRLLGELPNAAPELAAEVKALADALRRERRHTEELEAERREMDLSVHNRHRHWAIFGGLSVLTVIVVLINVFHVLNDASYADAILTPSAFAGLLGAMLLFGRRRLMKTVIERRLMWSILLITVLMIGSRVIAWLYEAPIRGVFTMNLWSFGITFAILGITIHPRLIPSALPYFVGLGAIALWPQQVFAIFGTSALVGVGVFLYLMWTIPKPKTNEHEARDRLGETSRRS